MNKAVDLSSVKKSVLSSVWLMCSECLKERTMIDGEPATSHDILVCLKCGSQVRSVIGPHTGPRALGINISTVLIISQPFNSLVFIYLVIHSLLFIGVRKQVEFRSA